MLTQPYVTVGSFKAYPTFLELANLRSGDSSPAHQDAQLSNMLLMASQWADDQIQMGSGDGSFAAHTRVENARLRLSRSGRISYHPNQNPVTALTALSMGPSPNTLTPLTDLSNLWIEDSCQIVGYPAGAAAPAMSALQFGPPTAAVELYTRWTYVTGYVSTLLAAPVAAGGTSFTVTNPAGIVAGTILRIWDPGAEEAVTVASSYVPGSTTVPITGVLANAHNPATSGATSVTNLPPTVLQAIVFYAIALLLRPDTTKEDEFPDARVSPSTRSADSRLNGSGLVAQATQLLADGGYSRVR